MTKLLKHGAICVENDIIYLNHAAISPWPAIAKDTVIQFSTENASSGSKNYLEWLKIEQALRNNLAKLICHDNTDDIALVKNTSEGLSMVAYGYPWKPGDNVVIPTNEFPSNRIVWQSLQGKGVSTRQVKIFPAENPEDELIKACNEKTRIMSVSSVNYANGLKLDLEKLGKFCKQNNIIFCIDAIQSVGAMELDAKRINADFIVADGHKWMMGPEGLALFYSTPEAREQLSLFEYGWHMTEGLHDFSSEEFEVAKSARRFECGSPNMLCSHALKASTDFLLDIGIKEIQELVLHKSQLLHELINDSKNLTCISAQATGQFAGITTFTHNKIKSSELYDLLMKNNIMCANRMDGIRYSPHFYIEDEKLIQAVTFADNALKYI